MDRVRGRGSLKRVPVGGGAPRTLVELPDGGSEYAYGASWGSNDTIVFSQWGGGASGLWQVPAAGGEPAQLTTLDREQAEVVHLSPEFLPGGDALLFELQSGVDSATGAAASVAVLSLATGDRRVLLDGGNPRYVATGHIMFTRENALWRVPFDASRLEVTGEPVPVLEGVRTLQFGEAVYALSADGSLVYRPGGATGPPQRTLVWIDRDGREEAVPASPRAYRYPRISPNGTRVALDLRDEESDVWVLDFARETLDRVTVGPAFEEYPTWTPDGERVIFASARDGGRNPYWQAADGTGSMERLAEDSAMLYPQAVTPDGDHLILRARVSQPDLVVLELGEAKIEPLLTTNFIERNAEISPDGRWMAYESDESGQLEIYVRPWPDVEDGRTLVSPGGGKHALWSRSGRELFYRNLAGSLMSVPVELAPVFEAGTPTLVVSDPYYVGRGAFVGRSYDASEDGDRFLMIKPVDDSVAGVEVIFVQNWFEELQQLVPID